MERIASLRWTIVTGVVALLIGLVLATQFAGTATTTSVEPTDVPVPTELAATETIAPSITPEPTQPPTQTAVPTPTQIVIDKQSVIEKVKSDLKLVSAEAVVSVDVKFSDEKNMILTKGKYTVTAGIELKDVTKENVTVTSDGTSNIVTITLPQTTFIGDPAEVPGTAIVSDKIALTWAEGLGQFFFGKVLTIPETNAINTVQQAEALRRACEFGLLEFAADHARYELRHFLFNNDPLNKYNNYVVLTSAGTCQK
jgi:hypothetical protein